MDVRGGVATVGVPLSSFSCIPSTESTLTPMLTPVLICRRALNPAFILTIALTLTPTFTVVDGPTCAADLSYSKKEKRLKPQKAGDR